MQDPTPGLLRRWLDAVLRRLSPRLDATMPERPIADIATWLDDPSPEVADLEQHHGPTVVPQPRRGNRAPAAPAAPAAASTPVAR